MKASIAFGDGNRSGLEVEIGTCEGKKFTDSHAGPIQHLEDGMIEWGIYISNEMHIFILGPEFHFTGIATSHCSGFAAGIGFEVIIAFGIAEDGDKLIINGFKIGRGIILFHHFVLPVSDVGGGDFAHGFVSKVWKEFCCENFLFYIDRALFQTM